MDLKNNMENIRIITDLPVERWEEYKNLRIEALRNDPNGFSSGLEEALGREDSEWKERLEKNLKDKNNIVFAEVNGKLVGMGFIDFYSKPRFKHNASLQGLYVSPEYRGKGIGKMLVMKRIDIISENPSMMNILCDVYGSQIASIELHKNLGFEEAGRIKDFCFVDGKYFDLIQFVKRIK